MGVDVVIVVNVGTPLSGRESLSSVLGLTEQMIAILTEQNVERSIATLAPHDLLLDPDLGKLTSGDFAPRAATDPGRRRLRRDPGVPPRGLRGAGA